MAYTDAQLQSLQNAIASGELSVTFQGRTTTYRSIDDLQKALNIVQDSISKAAGTKSVRTVKTYMDDESGVTL